MLKQKRLLILILLASFLCMGTTDAATPQVALTSHSSENKTLTSKVVIDAPASAVWQILTNYNNLKNVLPGYEKSQVIQSAGATKTVQFAVKVAPILPAYQYQVQIRENQPAYNIHIKRVSGAFDAIDASYKLIPSADGTKTTLVYTLNIDLGDDAPKFGVDGTLKSSTQKAMAALQTHCSQSYRKSLVASKQ